jgi:hypothetical protein
MTTETASASPLLDTGDGVTHDRAAAIKATRLQIEAFETLHELPPIGGNDMHVELAYDRVADLLGGDHWMEIAVELVEEVLAEASHA